MGRKKGIKPLGESHEDATIKAEHAGQAKLGIWRRGRGLLSLPILEKKKQRPGSKKGKKEEIP